MTEVVILVVSTTLLIVWLFSLKAKAAQMRSQPMLFAGQEPDNAENNPRQPKG